MMYLKNTVWYIQGPLHIQLTGIHFASYVFLTISSLRDWECVAQWLEHFSSLHQALGSIHNNTVTQTQICYPSHDPKSHSTSPHLRTLPIENKHCSF